MGERSKLRSHNLLISFHIESILIIAFHKKEHNQLHYISKFQGASEYSDITARIPDFL
jgi:hypothetical protein